MGFNVSFAQFVVGPIVLLALPAKGFRVETVSIVIAGAVMAFPAVSMMQKELASPAPTGRWLPAIALCLTITVLCMANGRHLHRIQTLAEHRAAMQIATRG